LSKVSRHVLWSTMQLALGHNGHCRHKYYHFYICCMFTGEYPVMKPGASFTWISSTHFTTTYGNMRGHFTMINIHTGECTTAILLFLPLKFTSVERSLLQNFCVWKLAAAKM